MRRFSLILSVVLAAGMGLLAIPASPARAEGECPEGSSPIYQEVRGVEIVVGCAEVGGGGGGAEPGDPVDGGGGGSGEPRDCAWRGRSVPCQTSAGKWLQSSQCYASVAEPQPPAEHPIWGGHEPGDGVILACVRVRDDLAPVCDAPNGCDGAVLMWAAGPPDAGPSPIELARQALVSMRLGMGEIGVTGGDPTGTGWRSVIGLPIWLWIDNPAPNSVGPITASASDSGLTVTASAALDRVEWTLTSPSGVTSTICAGGNAPGTAYAETYGDQPSPTCGWSGSRIQQTGEYTLTGTAYWTVRWTGGGEVGTLSVDPISESMALEVMEVQTIRTDGG